MIRAIAFDIRRDLDPTGGLPARARPPLTQAILNAFYDSQRDRGKAGTTT